MKKILILFVLSCVLLVSCNQENGFNSDEGKEKLTTSIKESKEKVESAHSIFSAVIDVFDNKQKINWDNTIEYNAKYKTPSRAHINILIERLNEPVQKFETMFIEPDKYYIKNDRGVWEQPNVVDQDGTTSPLDYHEMLNRFFEIIKNEKFEVVDSNDNYEITFTEKDFDFKKYFDGQLDLTLKNVEQKDLDKKVVFAFEKNTFFLKYITGKFYYTKKEKVIDMTFEIKYDNLNNIDKSVFDVILE